MLFIFSSKHLLFVSLYKALFVEGKTFGNVLSVTLVFLILYFQRFFLEKVCFFARMNNLHGTAELNWANTAVTTERFSSNAVGRVFATA